MSNSLGLKLLITEVRGLAGSPGILRSLDIEKFNLNVDSQPSVAPYPSATGGASQCVTEGGSIGICGPN